MKTVTMSYPVCIHVEEDANGSKAYAFDVPGVTVEYGSNGTAVKKMKAAVKAEIDNLLKYSDREYQRQRMIVTNAGVVLVVQFGSGNWGYSISRAGNPCPSSTFGRATYEDTLDDARLHAESSYDGIAWESAL